MCICHLPSVSVPSTFKFYFLVIVLVVKTEYTESPARVSGVASIVYKHTVWLG